MIILFEDDKDTPSSRLLKASLLGDLIDFTGGANKVESKINEYLAKGETCIYVYLDVVLDNHNTVKRLNKLLDLYEHVDSVHIFPIFCMEFLILRVLCYYLNLPDISDFVETLHIEGGYKARTFEKYCKSVLSDLVSKPDYRCMRNELREENKRKEREAYFYLQDCSCDSCPLNITKETQVFKGNRLYSCLPNFYTTSEFSNWYKDNIVGIVLKAANMEETQSIIASIYSKHEAALLKMNKPVFKHANILFDRESEVV